MHIVLNPCLIVQQIIKLHMSHSLSYEHDVFTWNLYHNPESKSSVFYFQ